MRKIIIFCLIPFFTTSVLAQKKVKEYVKEIQPSELKTEADSLSYALGQSIGEGLKAYLSKMELMPDKSSDGFDAKANEKAINKFIEGLAASFYTSKIEEKNYNAGLGIGVQLSEIQKNFGKDFLLDEKLSTDIFIQSLASLFFERNSMIDSPEQFVSEKQIKLHAALKEKQIVEAGKFLEENKTKEGIHTLPSGVQYKILTEGNGEKPLKTNRVKVHYEGQLIDGTVFDSSYKRGEPISFGVTQVIKGWTEVLQLMRVGSKWTAYIPYDMGYGDRGSGKIPPYATLIFDIELLGIE